MLWPSAEVAPSVVDSTTAGVTEVALVEDAGVAVLLSEAAAVAVLVTVGWMVVVVMMSLVSIPLLWLVLAVEG